MTTRTVVGLGDGKVEDLIKAFVQKLNAQGMLPMDEQTRSEINHKTSFAVRFSDVIGYLIGIGITDISIRNDTTLLSFSVRYTNESEVNKAQDINIEVNLDSRTVNIRHNYSGQSGSNRHYQLQNVNSVVVKKVFGSGLIITFECENGSYLDIGIRVDYEAGRFVGYANRG